MKHLLMSLTLTLFLIQPVLAAGSGSSSSGSSRSSKEVKLYNEGVELMLDKKFFLAEMKFRNALDRNDEFAEAHNNLAYVLRKQGPRYFKQAMQHYTMAIDLAPELPEPYMYRGVLHMQLGNEAAARRDHETLVRLDPALAQELEYVIASGQEKQPEQFFGVSREM